MIGDKLPYKYIDKSAPSKKIDYSYSQFNGIEFISAWKKSRDLFCKQFPSKFSYDNKSEVSLNWENKYIKGDELFKFWIFDFHKNKNIDSLIYLLVKRFEVTRKIYETYSKEMRPNDRTCYHNYNNYALFGVLLGNLFQETHFYPFLNSLLKVNDILLGLPKTDDSDFLPTMSMSIYQEKQIIESLIEEKIE